MSKKNYKLNPPKSLSTVAGAHWTEFIKAMKEIGRELSETDYYLIECACMQWESAKVASESIARDGSVFKNAKEELKANPSMALLNQATNRYQSILAELQLTAKSSRVEARKEDAELSPMDKLAASMSNIK